MFQDTLEAYIDQYLEEAGLRLDLLTSSSLGTLDDTSAEVIDVSLDSTNPMNKRMLAEHDGYVDSMTKLLHYIRDNDPKGWKELWEPVGEAQDVPVNRAVEFYRRCFSPGRYSERLATLESEHDSLTADCLKLKTERSIAKANQQLADLEAKIAKLEQQRENQADAVERQWREVNDLRDAIDAATAAMGKGQSLRQRAEALRAIIHRIECTFTATGVQGGGWGKKNSKLVSVTVYPVVGESVVFPADSKGTLPYSKAHSCMYRTCFGSMR